jgi:hypothetical protein
VFVTLAIVTLCRQGAAQDVPASQALFDRGKEALLQGDFDKACPSLHESYRLDPQLGTLFTLAECERQRGRIATAAVHYRTFTHRYARLTPERQAPQRKRHGIALGWLEELSTQVPTLAVELRGPDDGCTVLRDGRPLQRPSLNVALPLDPGDHALVVVEPAGTKKSTSVKVEPGSHVKVVLSCPSHVHEETKPASTGVLTAPTLSRDALPPDEGSSRTHWPLAVGAAGLALGAVSGGLAWRERMTVDEECEGTLCSQAGTDAAHRGKRWATVSTVSFGVGLCASAVALGVWLLDEGSSASPPSARRSPSLGFEF